MSPASQGRTRTHARGQWVSDDRLKTDLEVLLTGAGVRVALRSGKGHSFLLKFARN